MQTRRAGRGCRRRTAEVPLGLVGGVDHRPLRDQLLGRRRARRSPPARVRVPYSPFFVQQVTRGTRRVDHLEGHGDPGDVHQQQSVRRLEADDALQDRDPRVRRHGRARAAAPEKRVVVNARAARHGRSVVAEPAARVRADDPLHRAALLADAPRGRCAERARRVRPLARAPLRARRRPGDVRRRRRDRRGEGGALGGRRLPAQPGQVPPARRAHPARRPALGPARAPARRCSRARSPARRTCRSSRWPRPSSSRRSSASAPSRVRDLFKQAKEAAPAIVFIDELDAIGRSRTSGVAGFSGGNDEREQTLNQILTEMDGFDSSTSVIVIARDEPARRARPGAAPARAASTAASRCSRPTGPAARRSSRCTRAACRSRPTSTSAGSRRRRPAWSAPTSRTSSTRRRCSRRAASTTQVHGGRLHRRARADRARRRAAGDDEPRRTSAAPPTTRAGTRSSACSPPGADPVRKISIIPRGQSLGVTFSAPDADRFNYSRAGARARRSRSRSAAARRRRSSSAS